MNHKIQMISTILFIGINILHRTNKYNKHMINIYKTPI